LLLKIAKIEAVKSKVLVPMLMRGLYSFDSTVFGDTIEANVV